MRSTRRIYALFFAMLFCLQSIGLPLVSTCDGCEHACCAEEVELFACCLEEENDIEATKISKDESACCDESLDVYVQDFDAFQVVQGDFPMLNIAPISESIYCSLKTLPLKLITKHTQRGPPDYFRSSSFLCTYRC